MITYRIVLAKYADSLVASGRPARWNSSGVFVIYSASTRALACLENLVHRSGEGLHGLFKTVVVDIPASIKIEEVQELPKNWTSFKGQSRTKFIGDTWVRSRKSCVMKVPSAIIPEESNYLLNPNHSDFNQLSIIKTEDFLFDQRFS